MKLDFSYIDRDATCEDKRRETQKVVFSVSIGALQCSVFVRERGDIGIFITLVPKFYNNVFLFVG